MPGLSKDYFEKYIQGFSKNFFKDYPYFLETGTHKAQTSLLMKELFERVDTIEVNSKFYNENIKKYHDSGINFHFGDSGKIIKDIVPNLDKPTVFFFDAHGAYHEGQVGEKDVPLYEEISEIVNNFKHKAIIIVDDFRLFGTKSKICDWSYINKETVLNLLKQRDEKLYHAPSKRTETDRLIIHLK